MVAKSEIKFIKSLQQKKCRNEHGLFVAEGIKLVKELLNSSFRPYALYTTDGSLLDSEVPFTVISEAELGRMSGLRSPNVMLAVFHVPQPDKLDFSNWVVALDQVRDPGNLGTIIRLCDWFNIDQLLCSLGTVDCFNPKVLQATMGSIARVNVVYADLEEVLHESDVDCFGAFMGNEANGISEKMERLVKRRLSIPQYGAATAESLNVAMATGILLGEIRRR